MSYNNQGKYVVTDFDNPEATGVCDYSKDVFPLRDLVRQMEWRGNSLVWNGFLVGRPHLDVPNEQERSPILAPDPIPEQNPRVMRFFTQTWNSLDVPYNLMDTPWSSLGQLVNGVPAPPVADRIASLRNFT